VNEPEIGPASESEVRAYAARRWPDEAGRRLYVHLATTSRGVFVGRDAGEPVGIAFAHDLEGESFVSELFVEPSFRKAGLGRALLRAATRDGNDLALAALVDANDIATLAFCARSGIGLNVPVLQLSGAIPKEDALLPTAAGDYRFATLPIDSRPQPTIIGVLGTIDREVRGVERESDHRFFAEHACGTLLLLEDEPVGYVYVWPDGRVGPIAAASAAYVRQFLAFALVAMRRNYGASWCTLMVPGSNVRVLRAAMRIGLKVERSYIFAADAPAADVARYVGFHPLAF